MVHQLTSTTNRSLTQNSSIGSNELDEYIKKMSFHRPFFLQ